MSNDIVIEAGHPFNSPKADLILRSIDNADFRMFKSLLSMASPFFETMFTLPPEPSEKRGDQETKDGLAVVTVEEESSTLRNLLMFCRIGKAPDLQDRFEVQAALRATMKYEMEEVAKRILSETRLHEHDPALPLMHFAVACHYGWEDEIQVAARHSLRFPESSFPATNELKYITALNYLDILRYHRTCGEAAKKIALLGDGYYRWLSYRKWGAKTWFSYPWRDHCEYGGTMVLLGNSTTACAPRKWWIEYMTQLGAALAVRPCGSTITENEFLNQALQQAYECAECHPGAINDMRAMNALFATEVERVVSEVSHRPFQRLQDVASSDLSLGENSASNVREAVSTRDLEF